MSNQILKRSSHVTVVVASGRRNLGQKVHPIGFRLGVIVGNRHVKEWMGKWYADKDYTKFLHEDLRVRQLIMGRLAEAGVSR